MKHSYYIIVPAYNEERTLSAFFESIARAVKFADKQFTLEKTYICINGCTDKTEQIAKILQKTLSVLKINILYSEKGMNKALCTIISKLEKSDIPIIKVDADVQLSRSSIHILLNELCRHPELLIVGGHPFARQFSGESFLRTLLARMIDIRSRYPLSQVATKDVSSYHELALVDPQPNMPYTFELRSRIYFHGRFYVLRNKDIWRVPPDRIGDDTYLTLDVYSRFGRNSIRIRYDAACFYEPTTSLKEYWKVYKRIFCDTYTLFMLPEFQTDNLIDVKNKIAVKLDWDYIRSLPLRIQLTFIGYVIIKKTSNLLFHISPKYNDNLWTYERKIH